MHVFMLGVIVQGQEFLTAHRNNMPGLHRNCRGYRMNRIKRVNTGIMEKFHANLKRGLASEIPDHSFNNRPIRASNSSSE